MDFIDLHFFKSVIGALLISLGGVMFIWFFMIPDSLQWSLIPTLVVCIWVSYFLFQTLSFHYGKQSFTSLLSSGFRTCHLIIYLSRWNLLSGSILRWGHRAGSEVMMGVGESCHWLITLDRTVLGSLIKEGCRMGSMITWILWSVFPHSWEWLYTLQ